MKKQNGEREQGLTTRGILARVLLGVASWAVVAAVVMFNVMPHKYSLQVGKAATETIVAPRDIEDKVTTRERRQAAMDAVPEKYRQDDTVTQGVLTKLNGCYAAIDRVRTTGLEEIRKLNDNQQSSAYRDPNTGNVKFTDAFMKQSRETLPASFTDEDVLYIVLSDGKAITALKDKVTELITQALKNGVRQEYLDQQKAAIAQELINPLNRFDAEAQGLGMNLVSAYLEANFILDQTATEEAKRQAAEAVKPEIYTYGQNITRAGEKVTEAQLMMLSDLGMLDENNPHILIYIGIGAFTGLILLLVWLYMLYFNEDVFMSFRKLVLIHFVIVFTVGVMWLGRAVHYYFLLSTAGALLIAVLVNIRPAIFVNAMLALLAGVLAGSQSTGAFSSVALPAAVAAFAGGTVGLFAVRKTPHRSALMLAGILSGLLSSAVCVAADFVSALDLNTILKDLGYSLAGGIVSSMLCLGTLPLWESLFKVVTPMRLLELANPNHPLLKRLLMEASGTYHHSIIVGNLAESAAEAIGANPLLTRTGAYYHDVGKLVRPYFFTENQLGDENPHESITPELSKRILTSHTKDGVELAAKYGLPQQVQDIIQEHHGTTPVMYFYHKAVKAAKEGETVSLDDYRYAGPKPRSREAAVIMLADSVEAGARALQDHSQEKLDEFVQQIVNMKLEDGQFANCDLTMRDLSIISAEFRKVLGGVFHERVVYPAMPPLTKENGLQ